LLQEKEYERVGENKTRRANVRVIAATNRDLQQLIHEKRFREDLYYRLNVISVRMPSLRERLSDLPGIMNNYLQFFAAQCGKHISGFSEAATQALQEYSWPGNLRELRNVVERAVILAPEPQIELEDLPERLIPHSGVNGQGGVQLGARISLAELESEHIARVLGKAATLEEAARILGIDPATLYRKRKRMSLQTET
jgi:NtrC-family two-component system response regulator AlgB